MAQKRTLIYQAQLLDSGVRALDELKTSGRDLRLRSRRQRGGRLSRRDRTAPHRLHPACGPLFTARPLRRARPARSVPPDSRYRSSSAASSIPAFSPPGRLPGANFDYGPASDDVLARVRAMQQDRRSQRHSHLPPPPSSSRCGSRSSPTSSPARPSPRASPATRHC